MEIDEEFFPCLLEGYLNVVMEEHTQRLALNEEERKRWRECFDEICSNYSIGTTLFLAVEKVEKRLAADPTISQEEKKQIFIDSAQENLQRMIADADALFQATK